jgi:hypothetical protein
MKIKQHLNPCVVENILDSEALVGVHDKEVRDKILRGSGDLLPA